MPWLTKIIVANGKARNKACFIQPW